MPNFELWHSGRKWAMCLLEIWILSSHFLSIGVLLRLTCH
jgi:hypothetical protein